MSGDIAAIYGYDVDTTNVPESTYDALPPGWYPALVEKAEMRTTKDNTGRYLWLQFEVVGDHGKGKKLFTNINLVNANQKAVEIGARELAHLGSACGLLRLSDSSELVNKVIQVRVTIKKDDANENDIKGFKALDGGVPATMPPPASTYTPPPATSVQAPPQAQPLTPATYMPPPAAKPQAQPQAAPAATAAKMPWMR